MLERAFKKSEFAHPLPQRSRNRSASTPGAAAATRRFLQNIGSVDGIAGATYGLAADHAVPVVCLSFARLYSVRLVVAAVISAQISGISGVDTV